MGSILRLHKLDNQDFFHCSRRCFPTSTKCGALHFLLPVCTGKLVCMENWLRKYPQAQESSRWSAIYTPRSVTPHSSKKNILKDEPFLLGWKNFRELGSKPENLSQQTAPFAGVLPHVLASALAGSKSPRCRGLSKVKWPRRTVDGGNPSNHLGCKKPCKWCEIYHINSCRIFFHQQCETKDFAFIEINFRSSRSHLGPTKYYMEMNHLFPTKHLMTIKCWPTLA